MTAQYSNWKLGDFDFKREWIERLGLTPEQEIVKGFFTSAVVHFDEAGSPLTNLYYSILSLMRDDFAALMPLLGYECVYDDEADTFTVTGGELEYPRKLSGYNIDYDYKLYRVYEATYLIPKTALMLKTTYANLMPAYLVSQRERSRLMLDSMPRFHQPAQQPTKKMMEMDNMQNPAGEMKIINGEPTPGKSAVGLGLFDPYMRFHLLDETSNGPHFKGHSRSGVVSKQLSVPAEDDLFPDQNMIIRQIFDTPAAHDERRIMLDNFYKHNIIIDSGKAGETLGVLWIPMQYADVVEYVDAVGMDALLDSIEETLRAAFRVGRLNSYADYVLISVQDNVLLHSDWRDQVQDILEGIIQNKRDEKQAAEKRMKNE